MGIKKRIQLIKNMYPGLTPENLKYSELIELSDILIKYNIDTLNIMETHKNKFRIIEWLDD